MPDIFHAIRLKRNGNLRKLASHIDEQLAEITKDDMVSYAVYYGISVSGGNVSQLKAPKP